MLRMSLNVWMTDIFEPPQNQNYLSKPQQKPWMTKNRKKPRKNHCVQTIDFKNNMEIMCVLSINYLQIQANRYGGNYYLLLLHWDPASVPPYVGQPFRKSCVAGLWSCRQIRFCLHTISCHAYRDLKYQTRESNMGRKLRKCVGPAAAAAGLLASKPLGLVCIISAQTVSNGKLSAARWLML